MAGAEDLPPPQHYAENFDPSTDLKKIALYPTLVATGPLTNIALQVLADPVFSEEIDHLYIMGGCPYPEPLRGMMGNYLAAGTDDYAEYNFAVDPEAAKIVFRAGFKKITVVGLNVTRAMLYDGKTHSMLRGLQSKVANKAADILSTLGEDDESDYGHIRKTPDEPVRAIHDVVAMAALDAPELFTFETVPLRILAGALPEAAGQSLIDFENYDHPAVRVAISIDHPGFIERLINHLGKLDT